MTDAAWTMALELGPDRTVRAGSKEALAAAIARGADLRVYTEFLYEEHIRPGVGLGTPLEGLIREVIDFRETILVDGRHVAAVTTLRQPLEPPHGFNGPDAKMSYFLYTMDGDQANANLLFVDVPGGIEPGVRSVSPTPDDMPKMSAQESFDVGTSGPSRNFVYDMETYRYFVRDDWEEILSHDPAGTVLGGSFGALEAAQIAGREIKVGIRDLAADLAEGLGEAGSTNPAETFSLVGSGFVHVRAGLYATLTHPIVRVAARIPMGFGTGIWDVAWVFLRTDGQATIRRIDPYTRAWTDRGVRLACRWFAR